MSTEWLQQLDDARACGVPGVILSFNTSDRIYTGDDGEMPMSLRYFLAARMHKAGRNVGHYSHSGGFTEIVPPGAARQPSATFDRLKTRQDVPALLRNMGAVLRDPNANCTLLIEYASHLVPHPGNGTTAGYDGEKLLQIEMLHEWSLDDTIRRSGNFLVLLNHSESLNSLIDHQGGFRHIQVGLPGEKSRLRFAEFISRPGFIGGKPEADLDLHEFARLTNGLRLRDIEQLFRESAARSTVVTRRHIREHKKQAIHQLCGGLLEVTEPGEGFCAVAGCHHAKSYFNAIKPLWRRGHRGLPQAVLLAGVPGAGKSHLIKAIAREFDAPCLAMRGIREMWVGESERNLDRVLRVLEDLAPCLLWTDEIDQTLGGERASGPSGDSGINDRLLGRLLEFFGDSRLRGRVLWIASTNRPDLLDVAIKDRFSVKIPFLHPNRREREELLPLLAAQIGRTLAPDVDCAAFSARPELDMLSVRSLQEVVAWAGLQRDLRAVQEQETPITVADLDKAIRDYKPAFDPLEQEHIALTALQMSSFTSMLPWMNLEGAYDPANAAWPAYVDPLVDRASGRLDAVRLEQRIRELRRGHSTS